MKKVESEYTELLAKLEQVKSENIRLKQELNYFDKLFSHLYCVIFKFYKRDDGRFVYSFSDGILAESNQLRGSSLIGHTVEEMFPLTLASILNEKYELAFKGEQVTFEVEFHEHVYLTVLSPIIESGKTTEVVGTAIDITEQKYMEGEMNTNKSKFTSIFNEAQDAILLFDDTGVPIEANPAASELLGFTTEEIKNGEHSPLLNQSVQDGIPEKLEMLLKRGSLKGESVVIRKDGTPRYVEHHTKANILPSVHLTILRDITERKLLEESLRKSETLQVVGELAAGIGHEIRNPMTALKGFIQLLKENPTNDQYFEVILSEFQRIETIVSEFMVLARPHALQMSKEDVSHILKSTITLINPLAMMKNIRMNIRVESGIPKIMCEKNQLKQVFINIIKNGVESMDADKTLTIIAKQGENGEAVIEITDEGCGIPDEFLDRLGQPFYTTKSKGTGLGLMVSYRIIQNHKGTIQVKSKQNIGTTFTVTLPAL